MGALLCRAAKLAAPIGLVTIFATPFSTPAFAQTQTINAADIADKVVEVITANARTGQIGDGKIFVTPIDRALRIRTGETDSDAL